MSADVAAARAARAAREPIGPAAASMRSRLRRSPSAVAGIVLTSVVVGVGLFAPALAPHDPFSAVGTALSPPSSAHPMGTDDLGRDVLSGVIHGARASLVIGLSVAVLVAAIGLAVGIVSGYAGGRTDDVLMRMTEAVQALPRFFLVLVVVTLYGPALHVKILVLGFTSWAVAARVVRAETLSLRRREFIEATRALGAPTRWILLRHVLPNVASSITTLVGLMAAQAILVEASLGFLGLGDPSTMSWGVLAGNAQPFIRVAWWLAVFPGGAIALAVLGINLLGDGVLEDERQAERRGR